MNDRKKFMQMALAEAKKAEALGEIPVGAVIVKCGEVISRAYNLRETRQNALCHAEISAIDGACKKLKSWRLDECDMYVTLEPCHMCIGAIIQSRIKNLYFGAYDKKAGAVFSLYEVPKTDGLSHRVTCFGGVLEEDCAALIKNFFNELRR